MKVKKLLTKNNTGLFLSVVGALLIASSVGVYPEIKGIPYNFLGFTSHYYEAGLMHPWFLRLGIILTILGFGLQLNSKSK